MTQTVPPPVSEPVDQGYSTQRLSAQGVSQPGASQQSVSQPGVSKQGVSKRIFVHPSLGRDSAEGTASSPLRTLTQALRQAQLGSVIQLAPGRYQAETGEEFPLQVPEGVIVLGDEATKGAGITIEGGGGYTSPSLGLQQVSLRLGTTAQVRGVTITNPLGTGIWIEVAAAVVYCCTLRGCGREGILSAGIATPLIRDCVFRANRTSGLTMLHQSKGEVWGNVYQQTSIGLAIGGESAPILVKNVMAGNTVGLAIAQRARPVLRANVIENNQDSGLRLQDEAIADLGSSQDPAGNILRGNQRSDLNHSGSQAIVSVGNQLNPTRTQGKVQFVPSDVAQPLPLPEPEIAAIASEPMRPSPPVNPDAIHDLEQHWAEVFIRPLLKARLLRGFPDSSFRPDAPLTRAEYAALISATFASDPGVAAPLSNPAPALQTFQDIPPHFWAAGAIATAQRLGFISGFPDGTFRANQPLTRVQAILSLVNGLGLEGGTPGLLTVYSDRAQIPSYATQAIATATQHRLVVNHPQLNQLDPLRPISRAETAVLLYQALVVQRRMAAIDSPFIPQPLLPSSLSDLQNHWAETFIRPLIQQNLVQGFPDGSFQPDGTVSRAQFAALIARAFNPPPRFPAPNFEDVPPSFWAKGAIAQATQGGFLAGSSSRLFLPDRPMLRFQVLLSLVSGLQLRGGSEDLTFFQDQASLPNYARKAVAIALHNRLIVGAPDPRWLRPTAEVSRGEVAAMIYQGLLTQGRLTAVPSAYIAVP